MTLEPNDEIDIQIGCNLIWPKIKKLLSKLAPEEITELKFLVDTICKFSPSNLRATYQAQIEKKGHSINFRDFAEEEYQKIEKMVKQVAWIVDMDEIDRTIEG